MTEQAVRVERSGPVTTVYLHRPARRNAVDGPTAAALAAAFRAFDADPDAGVEGAEGCGQRDRGGAVHGVAAGGAVQVDGGDGPRPLDPDSLFGHGCQSRNRTGDRTASGALSGTDPFPQPAAARAHLRSALPGTCSGAG